LWPCKLSQRFKVEVKAFVVSVINCNIFAAAAAANMMSTQYYGMPGATPPSWGIYQAQNALMSGQQTPGTPGTPQPTMIRSQPARSVTPHQQQDAMTGPGGLAPATLHTPGQLLLVHLTALYWLFVMPCPPDTIGEGIVPFVIPFVQSDVVTTMPYEQF